MKKLLLMFLLLFPIKTFASGYQIKDIWEEPHPKSRWILVIEEDETGKEIKRYGFWYNTVSYKYYVKYSTDGDDENDTTTEVGEHTYWMCKEYNYYSGEVE